MADNENLKVVTPAQLAEGYMVFNGLIAVRHEYMPIAKLPDGNWIVRAPDGDDD